MMKTDPASAILAKMNACICARTTEIENIKKHFMDTLDGECGVCFVSGPPGIGKTYLVEHAMGEISADQKVVTGKFRQHDEKPLIAVSEVLEQITKYIFTLPQDELHTVKQALHKALGANADMITFICPYVEKLLGEHARQAVSDYKRSKYRMRRAIQQFLSIVGESLFPLVIFIDDLHWADAPSMDMIGAILKSRQYLNLFFVFTYRDNDAGYLRKMAEWKQSAGLTNELSIELKALTGQDIDTYMEMVFGRNTPNLTYAARMIFGLSLGNPLYIREIVELLMAEEVFMYMGRGAGWTVHTERIADLSLPERIEEAYAKKMERIGAEDKRLLEYIACLDGQASVHILSGAMGMDVQGTLARLHALCAAAYLVRRGEGKAECFGFIHDTLLDRVYQDIPAAKRAEMHSELAGMLAGDTEEMLLLIGSQLLRADISYLKKDAGWPDVLYRAGIAAKQTLAIEQAHTLFLRYLDMTGAAAAPGKLAAQLQIAECLFIEQKQAEARRLYGKLIGEYNAPRQQLLIKRRYLDLNAYHNDAKNVLALGKEILRLLHYRFDTRFFSIGLLLSWKTKRGIERLKRSPRIQDERILNIFDTLTKMAGAAFMCDVKLFQVIFVKMGVLCIRHGYTPAASIGYAAYSLMYNSVWKNPGKMRRVAEIALERLSHERDMSGLSTVYFVFASFILPLTHPMPDAIRYLEMSVEAGKSTGEIVYSSYSAVSIIYARYMMGEPLPGILRYIEELEADPVLTGHGTVTFASTMYRHHIRYLKEGKSAAVMKQHAVEDMTYKAFLIQELYLAGHLEEAYLLLEEIASEKYKGYIFYMDVIFYSALVRIDMHDKLPRGEQKANRRQIKKYIGEFQKWTDECRENHYARLLLIQAQYATCMGKGQPLDRLYNEAIRYAQDQGAWYLAALGNLLAARRHHGNPRLSRYYAMEAVGYFRKWGADHIAGLVEQEFDGRPKKQEHASPADSMPGIRGNEVLKTLAQIPKMDEAAACLHMVDLMHEISGADYTAVLFERTNDMYLLYDKRETAAAYAPPREMHAVNISHRIIRYVQRTGEEVILDHTPDTGLFANDRYMEGKQGVSILCIPVQYHGILIGVIYQEKTGVFSEAAVNTVKSVVPAMVSKRTIIGSIDMKRILRPEKRPSPLTAREQEILARVAKGRSNAAISDELCITMGTVKNHLSNIYAKLEVESRLQAVVKAREKKLL